MKTTLIVLSLITINALLFSCTVEKRIFNKGYHIEWNRKFKTSETHPDPTELNDYLASDDRSSEIKNDVSKELQSITDTISLNTIETPKVDSKTRQDNILKTIHVREKRTGFQSIQKKFNSFKWTKHAYGGTRRGARGLIFVVVFLLVIGLAYLAFSSANYAAGFLLLAFAGWLILALFIVLLLVLFIRLFFGAFR